MLRIALLSAGILRHVLRPFFHVVHLCMGNNTRYSHGMTNVLSEAHTAAAHFPRAPIISGKPEFLRAVPLRQTTCNVPYVALRFGGCRRKAAATKRGAG